MGGFRLKKGGIRIMDKERLVQIGKFLNDRLIIHRNVENNTPWTTEEKMIQELYDNYLDILIKYKKQKEVIDKAREFINENKDKYYQDWGQDDCSVDIYLGEYEIKELLDILNEVSE